MRRLLNLRFGVVVLGIVAFAGAFLFEVSQRGTSEEQRLRQLLDQEWATVRAHIQIQDLQPVWTYDRSDPEEASLVNRIREGVYLPTDARQTGFERSKAVQGISLTRLHEEGVWFHRTDENGTTYLLRKAVISDQAQHSYFVVIGKPIADDGSTRLYWLVGLSSLLLCGLAAWAIVPLRPQQELIS